MPIVVNLDVMLARRKMKSKDLADAIGISETNLSLLKQGRVKGVRFGTLEAICRVLECQPDWCRVVAGGEKGWVAKAALWGVAPDELRD